MLPVCSVSDKLLHDLSRLLFLLSFNHQVKTKTICGQFVKVLPDGPQVILYSFHVFDRIDSRQGVWRLFVCWSVSEDLLHLHRSLFLFRLSLVKICMWIILRVGGTWVIKSLCINIYSDRWDLRWCFTAVWFTIINQYYLHWNHLTYYIDRTNGTKQIETKQ